MPSAGRGLDSRALGWHWTRGTQPKCRHGGVAGPVRPHDAVAPQPPRQNGNVVLNPVQITAGADAYLGRIGADGTATATANLVTVMVTIVPDADPVRRRRNPISLDSCGFSAVRQV